MENQQLLNKVIIVSEIKVNQGNVKIVDEKGLTYTIWETKKNGDKTIAYQSYEGLGNISGKSLEIGYDEKDIPDSQGKYRNIKTLKMVASENMSKSSNIPADRLTNPLEAQNEPSTSNYKPTSPQENTYNQEIDKKAQEDNIKPTQAQEIRANVALKMVSEIIASGAITIEDWEKFANKFYNYSPEVNEEPIIDEEAEYNKPPF